MKVNKLLTPKWKQRTHDTHLNHEKEYKGREFDIVFFGDSMTERWGWTVGGEKQFKTFSAENKVALLGVGGDGIEHALYRLDDERCIFGNIKTKKINIMIGTNNLGNTSAEHIVEGIRNIIRIISLKQGDSIITFYALPFRTDVPNEKVISVNNAVLAMIKSLENSSILFDSFVDCIDMKTDYEDHVHLNSNGYQKWFEYLTK